MTNFLQYSNETQSNIIPKESFDELVQEVFSTIAATLSKSLGPLGSSSLIIDGNYTSASKDGFTIFKNIRFRNKYKTMIYNLIKAPCVKLNNTVGDATTTAIILTELLFNGYMKEKNAFDSLYRLPRNFTQTWDKTVEEIIELVKSYSSTIEDNQSIYDVAYIASNGNDEISTNIANAYNESSAPIIKLKNSPTNKSYIKSIKGFEFPANLIDEAYCKNEDLSTEESNVKVLLFNYKIDNDTFTNLIKIINEIYRPFNSSDGEKILVLAPAYDELLGRTVLKTYINNEYRTLKELNLILTQYAYGKLNPNQIEDLAIVLGCELINIDLYNTISEEMKSMTDGEKYEYIMDDKHNILGNAKNVSLSIFNGSVFTVDEEALKENNRYIQQLKNANVELKSIMDKVDNDKKAYAFDISKAKSRIAQLEMENYIYYVGADSSLQANILYDTVDDVIKAVSSANKYGIVPGCQISIIRACNELLKAITGVNNQNDILRIQIINLIKAATVQLYAKILHGPNNNGIIKTIPNLDQITDRNQIIELANNKCVTIISESLEKNIVYDLETLSYTNKVITSVETDTNVLLAASELVKLLISGNQCVFIDYSDKGVEDSVTEI